MHSLSPSALAPLTASGALAARRPDLHPAPAGPGRWPAHTRDDPCPPLRAHPGGELPRTPPKRAKPRSAAGEQRCCSRMLVSAPGRPQAGPHKSGTLACRSRHRLEGNCLALPEPSSAAGERRSCCQIPLSAPGRQRACPHKSGTLAHHSRQSPEGSRVVLPEPSSAAGERRSCCQMP